MILTKKSKMYVAQSTSVNSNDYIDFKSILNSKDKIILRVGWRGQGKSQALLAQLKKITKER